MDSSERNPMNKPEMAVVVTTYERPWHLRRVLLSLAVQKSSPPFEIVVADDGSQDETPRVVERFRQETGLPVKFVTHPHEGFCPARARNEGFAATVAAYVLFLDGDCVVPPDHLAIHMRARQPGRAMTTDCLRLSQEVTQTFTEEVVQSGVFTRWMPRREIARLRRAHWKAVFYHFLRHPTKPRVLSGNLALWREDFERINGFDENYRGWGCEDDDLGLRLHKAGVRVVSLRNRTRTYHLWHPRVATAPDKIRDGVNIDYFHRAGRLTRCRNGLVKRDVFDLDVMISGQPDDCEQLPEAMKNVLLKLMGRARSRPDARPEVEILVYGWHKAFRTRAECRVLIVGPSARPPGSLVRNADIICLTDEHCSPDITAAKRRARVVGPKEMVTLWQIIG